MKKILSFSLLALALWCWWQFPLSMTQPQAAMQQHAEVVLYATRWCGYCKKTREFFTDNGIRYEERDIEASSNAAAEYQALGSTGVPVVVIDGEMIQGFRPSRMRELLAAP